METHKKAKPVFSQACDRLLVRIEELLGNGYDDAAKSSRILNSQLPSTDYFLNLRAKQTYLEPTLETKLSAKTN